MKKIAIVQSNYIPWKGYFDLIAAADEFILYDDMQYTRRDWRNRNQIKTPQGLLWLTVPVKTKGRYSQTIRETEIQDIRWPQSHWSSIVTNYRKSDYFNTIASWLEPLYLGPLPQSLSELNRVFLQAICAYLHIETKISSCSDYQLIEGKSERLADLCLQAGGTHYVSGPAAKSYLDLSVFSERDLQVEWFDYSGYPEYTQFWGLFTHHVSIIDVLFHCGKNTPDMMKAVRK